MKKVILSHSCKMLPKMLRVIYGKRFQRIGSTFTKTAIALFAWDRLSQNWSQMKGISHGFNLRSKLLPWQTLLKRYQPSNWVFLKIIADILLFLGIFHVKYPNPGAGSALKSKNEVFARDSSHSTT